MIYEVRHRTVYDYAGAVPVARCLMHLLPGDRPGQRVFQARLRVDPDPIEARDELDFFGNLTSWIVVATPHRSLIVDVVSTLAVDRGDAIATNETPPITGVRSLAPAASTLGPDSPAHFVFPSRHVPFEPGPIAYAAPSLQGDKPILAAALELAKRIKADFAYAPGTTDVDTPIAEAFAARRGVCQDFAHLMLAGLRAAGIPAAYVSGYLRTVAPPGQARLEGADAMHAWVAVWCGPALGWQGVDPTNGILVGDGHVVLAVGRDYADVSPVSGVVFYSGWHRLTVSVDVVEKTPAAVEEAPGGR